MSKRVLIVTQYFYPENFRITDYALYLVRRHCSVDVLTGIPNYPEGVHFDGYGIFRKRKENYQGINIFRAFQLTRGGKQPSKVRLSLNYLSFAICASLDALFIALFRKKYDAILVFAPSPITQAIPAVVLKKITGVPVYTWVQDIWPDSVMSSVGSDSKYHFVIGILSAITEWIYRNSRDIFVSSEGMIPLVSRRKDYTHKTLYVPNWCDDIQKMHHPQVEKQRDGYKIVMAGNLANGIGPDIVIELVESLQDCHDLLFVFIGGGAKEDYMREEFRRRGIENVVMTGRKPFSEMPSYFEQADALLLSLKPTTQVHLQATVPSRFQAYLSSGKPVLAMIDGDTKALIEKYDCGYVVKAGDYQGLSSYIREYVLLQRGEFAKKGDNCRKLYLKEFTPQKVCKRLTEILLEGNEVMKHSLTVAETRHLGGVDST